MSSSSFAISLNDTSDFTNLLLRGETKELVNGVFLFLGNGLGVSTRTEKLPQSLLFVEPVTGRHGDLKAEYTF